MDYAVLESGILSIVIAVSVISFPPFTMNPHQGHKYYSLPPWNHTKTGLPVPFLLFTPFVQTFRYRQSSLCGFPVCAANKLCTLNPVSVKFGNVLYGGPFARQSGAQVLALNTALSPLLLLLDWGA